MIYFAAITLLALSHLIYRRGKNGCCVSIRLEKITVLLAAIASFAAIVEFGSFVVSLFVREGDALSGWLPGMVVYPVGLIFFLFVVLVLLPKPIKTNKRLEDAVDQPPASAEPRS